jgi:hypothetical protein
VQFKGGAGRTYEYQYTGPVVQVLAGIELRIPRISYFFEYKLSSASYVAPLSGRDGTILIEDVWLQLLNWWRGKTPPGGHLETRLTSHNIGFGMGARIGDTVVAP